MEPADEFLAMVDDLLIDENQEIEGRDTQSMFTEAFFADGQSLAGSPLPVTLLTGPRSTIPLPSSPTLHQPATLHLRART